MGTDIHFFAELRHPITGRWTFLPAPSDGYSYDEARRIREKLGSDESYKPAHPYRYLSDDLQIVGGYEFYSDDSRLMRDWFDDRNYMLFGMLADVRNGTGFAGCTTGEPVEVIADPRGWPDDLSPELEAERVNIEHTPSWLTVAEMQGYFERTRSTPIVTIGVISGKQYEAMRDEGTLPTSWSGDISGPNIRVIAPDAYDSISRGRITHAPHHGEERTTVDRLVHVYVQAKWERPRAPVTARFEECLAEMVQVAGVGPANIRAVFYFDS